MELKPRTASIPIYQGDAPDRLQRLKEKIDAAEAAEKDAGPRMMADDVPESAGLREQYAALLPEAEADAVWVKLRNLGRRTWREFVDKHPPREGNESDENLGINEDTFFDEVVPIGLLAPIFGSDAERVQFLDDLSPYDWAQVKWKCWELNVMVTADPKPLPASQATQPPDET